MCGRPGGNRQRPNSRRSRWPATLSSPPAAERAIRKPSRFAAGLVRAPCVE